MNETYESAGAPSTPRATARGEALDLLDRDLGIVGVPVAEMVEHVGATGDETRDVRAHRHDETADGLALEHRVEGAHTEHLGRSHVEETGDLVHRLRAHPTVLVLRKVQERK